jgi:hypothetical protein
MTGRQTTPRQQPLGPDVGLTELVSRMITSNRVEQAKRRSPSTERGSEQLERNPDGTLDGRSPT